MAKQKYKSRQGQKYNDPNVTLAILVVAALVLYFAAISIPIGDKKDVYIDFTVQKELTGSPKLIQVSAHVQPATLLESPEFMGAIWGLQAGDVSVSANTMAVTKIIKIGDVTSGLDARKRLVLKSIPMTEKQVTLSLYEGTTIRETKVINI